MRKTFYIALFLLVTAFIGKGQDVHFSQFYSAPLYLNPALTGYFPCKLRIGLNYRSQWSSICPFKTQSVWGDGKLSKSFFRNDWFGLGGLIYGDQAGGGLLKNTKFMVSAAYHKGLFRNNMFNTSVGVSLGMVNRSAATGSFVFDSQWNGNTFSSGTPSGENFVNNSFYYFDLNVGILLAFIRSKYDAFLGVSLNHINKPNITFYGGEQDMSMRSVIHGGGTYKFKKIVAKPQFMFSTQDKAKEIIIGSNFIYNYKDKIDLYFGIWDRLSGDVIPTIGFDWRGWLILFNYDVNYSKLRSVTGMQGGWEISLIKTFGCEGSGLGSGKQNRSSNVCPAYR